jgi:UDP-GlcNAc:undecaprenyl-phosphate GlcNAc-1-phosphate transferase
LVGALAIRGSFKGPALVALAAPLAVCAIPILDSAAAIVRRKLTGRSIYSTDRGHLHHCLMAALKSNMCVLVLVGLCCAATCGGALIGLYLRSDVIPLGAVLSVVAALAAARLFGHVELHLVASRAKAMGVSLFLRADESEGSQAAHKAAIRLQGSRQWDTLWRSLTEFANKLRLHSINLDVNLPAAQEGYHASWRRRTRRESQELWRTEIPLFAENRVIGRLIVAGERADASACEVIDRLMDLLQPLEHQLVALALSNPEDASAAGSQIPVVDVIQPNGEGELPARAPRPTGALAASAPLSRG